MMRRRPADESRGQYPSGELHPLLPRVERPRLLYPPVEPHERRDRRVGESEGGQR